ncbi:hypothetical protein PV326_001247 [Microctonus aethiopoides]|nr:hypothetical protein PV326_001247 [Microctonus aethiopoides]
MKKTNIRRSAGVTSYYAESRTRYRIARDGSPGIKSLATALLPKASTWHFVIRGKFLVPRKKLLGGKDRRGKRRVEEEANGVVETGQSTISLRSYIPCGTLEFDKRKNK